MGKPPLPNHAPAKVCLRLTWLSTYSRKPAHPCMSPTSSIASRPSSASASIARAWFLLSPKKSPVVTDSYVLKRTPSPLNRRLVESAFHVPRHYCRLGCRIPSTAHLPARRSPSARFFGLPRAALFDSHHLDQWRSASQLERGVFSSLPLPVGAAGVVPADSEAGFGVLPFSAGRCGP